MTKSKLPYWRYREQGGFTTSRAHYSSYNNPNGAWYQDGFPNGTKAVMHDFVTPGFHEKSRSGKIVMSPMSRVIQSKIATNKSLASGRYNGNPSYWWRYNDGPRTIWTLGLNSTTSILPGEYSVHTSADLDRLQVEASTRCLSQVGKASTEMWENLAESRQTLGMLWKPIRAFLNFDTNDFEKWERRALREAAIRKGLRNKPLSEVLKFYSKRQLLGADRAASLWLQYRYGIAPLIRTALEVEKALQRLVTPPYQTSRGQATSSVSKFETVSYSNSGYTWQVRKSITETITVRAVRVDSFVWDWSHDWGFSSTELLQLPWNLTGHSFVADWFVNFGEYIGALANCFRPEALGHCLTTTVVRSGVWENISCTSSPSNEGMLTPHLDLVREDAVNKWRTPALRTPGIVVKSNFGFDNATRIGDALALVGQKVFRRFSQLL